jgi:hypothetical protein
MPWFDVEEALHASTLPPSLEGLMRHVREANADGSGIKLCPSRREAMDLAAFSNQRVHQCDLIAVACSDLAAIKDLPDQHDPTVHWLGFDVVLQGGWSLIGDWLFRGRGSPSDWARELNSNGLLASPYAAGVLVGGYELAVQCGDAEEFPNRDSKLLVPRVGRVEV